MKPTPCPTCGEPVEHISRRIHGPAWVDPCGHFVRLHSLKHLEAHPTYGADLREQDVDPECWEVWRLLTSRNGQTFGDPPVEWVQRYRRKVNP